MIRNSGTNGTNGFPKAIRLRKRKEFLRVQRSGHRAFTKHFIFFSTKNDCGLCRVGITASKRVGNAVERNRWKRRAREAFRQIQHRMETGKDLVVIARTGVDVPSLDAACKEFLIVDSKSRKNGQSRDKR